MKKQPLDYMISLQEKIEALTKENAELKDKLADIDPAIENRWFVRIKELEDKLRKAEKSLSMEMCGYAGLLEREGYIEEADKIRKKYIP